MCIRDSMKDFFSVSWVFMIPGTGKDVPVQPGEELVIAMMGIDHRAVSYTHLDVYKRQIQVLRTGESVPLSQ